MAPQRRNTVRARRRIQLPDELVVKIVSFALDSCLNDFNEDRVYEQPPGYTPTASLASPDTTGQGNVYTSTSVSMVKALPSLTSHVKQTVYGHWMLVRDELTDHGNAYEDHARSPGRCICWSSELPSETDRRSCPCCGGLCARHELASLRYKGVMQAVEQMQ